MKCPNCGAETNAAVCEYCGTQVKNPQGSCKRCGSTNLSFRRENQGEVKGKNSKQIVHRTVGVCKDCGYTWFEDGVASPKRKTWLWVLGWIFIFPLPLTILMVKNKKLKLWAKILIIAAAWAVYLLIAFAGKLSNNEQTQIGTGEPFATAEATSQNEDPIETMHPDATLQADLATEEPAATSEAIETTEAIDVSAVETTQLYQDFFEPYTDSLGKLISTGFATVKKLDDYRVEYTDGSEEAFLQYKIFADDGDYVYMAFFPLNVNDEEKDWVWTLTLLTYEHEGKEISISDNFHTGNRLVYNTFDPSREQRNEEVSTVEELITFMFLKEGE